MAVGRNWYVGIIYWGRRHSSIFASRLILVAQGTGAWSEQSFRLYWILSIFEAYLQAPSHKFIWMLPLTVLRAKSPPQLLIVLSLVFWPSSFTNTPVFSDQWCGFPSCSPWRLCIFSGDPDFWHAFPDVPSIVTLIVCIKNKTMSCS